MMRYVRYAAAGSFALLAIGFVALWVRSYAYCDGVLFGPRLTAAINGGIVVFSWRESPMTGDRHWTVITAAPRATSWWHGTTGGFAIARVKQSVPGPCASPTSAR